MIFSNLVPFQMKIDSDIKGMSNNATNIHKSMFEKRKDSTCSN